MLFHCLYESLAVFFLQKGICQRMQLPRIMGDPVESVFSQTHRRFFWRLPAHVDPEYRHGNILQKITCADVFSRQITSQVLLMNIQRDLDSLRQQAQAGGNINTADLPSTSVHMALTVMGILPVMVIYPFMQKYFVKGITIVSVKC